MRKNHSNYTFIAEHFVLIREAILEILEEIHGSEYDNASKIAIVKVCNIIRNLYCGYDPDDVPDNSTKICDFKKRVIQQSWKKLKRYPGEVSGPLVYKHMFAINP